jgi:Polyketide synthase dehydratase
MRVSAALCTMLPKKRVNFKAVFELTKIGAAGTNGKNGNHSYKEIPTLVPTSTDWKTLKEFSEPLDTLPVIDNVYGDWLFHGPLFQHIVSIDAIGTDGIAGRLSASEPGKCLAKAGAKEWTIDPVLLDSAMQLAGVWARQFLEITALPTGFRKLHLFPERAAKNFYARCFMDPTTTATDLTCNVAIYNEEGKLALLLEGLGGVGSKSLNRLAASQATPTGTTR